MKWIKVFIYSAGTILLAAALERVFVALGDAQVLSLPEPVMGIQLRLTVLLVGGFELVVALVCLFGKRTGLQLGWIAWLATNYFVYWIGLLTMHCHSKATCLGSLTDPLQITSITGGYFFEAVFAGLALASYGGLAWWWLHQPEPQFANPRRSEAAAEFLKIACPFCGVHIKFSAENLFQRVSCPQCEKAITLRRPAFLKMACFFCKEHIEFPAHAVGEKMPCPHCQKDITLKESA